MEVLGQLTQRFSQFGSDAQLMALKQLNQIAHRQAVVMAFADVFLMLTGLFLLLAVATLLIKPPKTLGAGGGGH